MSKAPKAPPADVVVLGAGLAGCEAALWLAGQGLRVALYEQKPQRRSAAHSMDGLAELVCSNSLKAERLDSAGGLLKAEMRRMGSALLPLADACRVPAGGALAVDREQFSQGVTRAVEQAPNIELLRQEAESLPQGGPPVIVATGPLTEGALAADMERLCAEVAEGLRAGGKTSPSTPAAVAGNGDGAAAKPQAPAGQFANLLSFYDAAAPIVTADSLDMTRVFAASRYGRGEDDYLNCPFDKPGYEAFCRALAEAETAPLHSFDKPAKVYEGCMPIEVMARRGPDTLRYGPLRPVGLTDPATGHRPWANVQLRRENAAGTLYNLVGFQTNLTFAQQRRVFRMVPGLEQAEFARYGVMHRNSFLNSPLLLDGALGLKGHENVYFAGQITGFEGYMESAACGLLAARALLARRQGRAFVPPPAQTMTGALMRYIAAPNRDFQPMGANMGLLPPLARPPKDKKERYAALASRALAALENWEFL